MIMILKVILNDDGDGIDDDDGINYQHRYIDITVASLSYHHYHH